MAEDEGFALHDEEHYISKIAYPHLLFIQMQSIMDTIRAGGSGWEELENLKALLKPSWRREIDESLKELKKRLPERLKLAERWRGRFGTVSVHEAKRRIIVEYVRAYVQKVVEKLDEVGLLLEERYKVLRGGGVVE